MAEKHPSWFKMKLERRELVRQLAPETAVNVLLACWEYLETNERPKSLSPIENVAFSAFIPDMEEAWSKYIKRVTNGAQGGRPKGEKPYGSVCPQVVPHGVEEETEVEVDSLLLRNKERAGTDKPSRPRSVPPSVDEVRSYCEERKNGIDPAAFVDYYQSRGWMAGRTKMKDWRAAVRTWERRGRADVQDTPAPKAKRYEIIDGEAVEVSDD